MKKGVIIQASSRSIGDTSKTVAFLKLQTQFDCVDLNKYVINHFDYNFKNKQDDFNFLFKRIVENYEVILFATPIYWYTMSGLLKVFMDRISDFLIHEKECGRMLRGKQMGIISCSNEKAVFDGFEMPFEKTAAYLGMTYLGHVHSCIEKGQLSTEGKNNIGDYVAKNINMK